MEKQIQVCGVLHMSGLSRKNNQQYNMFKLIALEPIIIERNITNASGYKSREYDCEEQVINQLKAARFPCDVVAFLNLNHENKVVINSVRISTGTDTSDIPMKSAKVS